MKWRKVLTVAAAAAAVGAFVAPQLSWADPTNPPLNQDGQHILASAPGYSVDDCNGVTAEDNEDIWVFVWPGNDTVGTINAVTIGWDTDGDVAHDVDETRSYPGPGATLIASPGTPKIAFVTPAGWRLETGSSSITGHTSSSVFNLTHTCAGIPDDGEEPPCEENPDAEGCTPPPPDDCTTNPDKEGCNPDPCASPVVINAAPGAVAQPDPCETPSEEESTPVVTTTPGLPKTGAALTGYLIAGAALVASGVVTLLLLRRRRDSVTPTL